MTNQQPWVRTSKDGLVKIFFLNNTFEDRWIAKHKVEVLSGAYLLDGRSTITTAPTADITGHLIVDMQGNDHPAKEEPLPGSTSGTRIVPITKLTTYQRTGKHENEI